MIENALPRVGHSLAPTSPWIDRAASRAVYRSEIDGLRALAVVPVVLYHAGFPIFGGGFVGVDVFFVISGYLITGNIYAEMSGGHFSIIDFYERRIRRILPALYFVMIASLPFAWLWLFPREFADFGRSVVSVCLFTSNIFFNGQINYYAPNTETWPLIHTWSLAVEEQFYLLFPILLLFSRGLSRRSLTLLLAALSVVSLGWADWQSRVDPQSDFYLLPTRAWELGFGAVVALIPRNKLALDPRLAEVLALIGLSLLALAIFYFRPDMPLPGLWSLAPAGGSALLIAFATARTECGQWLGARPFVALGLVSYSAYLWHQPLFAFARFRFGASAGGWMMLALSVASFAVAYASWRWVERPFRDRARLSRSSVFLAAFAVGITLIIVGRIITLHRGFPARMPAIEGAWDAGAFRNKCLDVPDLNPSRLAGMAGCQLGDPAAKLDFLLIGDSHAAALADGIDVAAFRRGRHGLILAANACLPIIGLEGQYAHSREACRRLHESLIDLIDHFGIGLVLMHARWQSVDETGVVSARDLKSKSQREAVMDHLLDTLTKFESHSVRVTIISDTPRAPFRVPDTLARNALYKLDVDDRPRLTTYLRENSSAQQIFEAPEINGRARIFDVYPFFCPPTNGGFCEVAEQGRPYFWDDNHLTSFGSLALSHLEEDVFK
ncbi:MAG: acyltransferase family protein [Roseiarcus sp.]